MLLCAGLIALLPAHADELSDIAKLARSGKLAEALNKTNESLARQPNDPQLRFMKGVLLTEQNKPDEAIAVFTRLTEDYKDLPEPYNNLAVLHAASGQYDKARIALEKAIRTNPSYMTAYENLGDVYGKLASQAYDKALALETAPAQKSKLTLLRTFSTTTGAKLVAPEAQVALVNPVLPIPKSTGPQKIPSMAAVPPPVQPPPAPPVPVKAPAPIVVAKADVPKMAAIAPAPVKVEAPQPAAPKPVAPPPPAPLMVAKVELPKAAPPAAVKVEPKVEPKAEPKTEAPKAAPPAKAVVDTGERDAVLGRVTAWAKAWAAQDVDGYLAFYSNDFDPPKGLTRKAWAQERRARIAGKDRIRVEVNAPQVAIDGGTAKVTFRQVYVSDRLSANSRKTLHMVKRGATWQIRQEISGG